MKTGAISFFIVVFGSFGVAIGNRNPAGPTVRTTERPEKARPRTQVQWTPAELAIRQAMEADPSYTSGSGRALTQAGAIAAWKRFLERRDLTKEHQVFAWWRIGSLYAYNLDPRRGEKSDIEQAKSALAKTREVFPGLVTVETLNSATVYGTLSGAPLVRARRLAEAFNWLAARSNDDLERSAKVVNRSGNVLDKKFFPNIANRPSTIEERKQFLHEQLAEYREFVAAKVTEAIRYSNDPAAIAELLKSIEDLADPKQMEHWQKMYRELKQKYPDLQSG